MGLSVIKLHPEAKLPEVAHPGEDLGYDLFALEDVEVGPHSVTKVRTGIAAQYSRSGLGEPREYGLLIRDRSSMALQGLFVVAGVVDYGYVKEICVLFRNASNAIIDITKGQKIAQMIPLPILADTVHEVDVLVNGERKAGFGSTGTH